MTESEWRPIKLEPPPEFQPILVAGSAGEVGEAWTTEGRFYWADDTLMGTPTHWMPLPEPPDAKP